MKRFFTLLPLVFLLLAMNEKTAYQLFTSEGKATDTDKMLRELAKADVILFGEQHNDSVAHALQLLVTQKLFQTHGSQLVLGAEMFESDVQLVLDEYLSGKIKENNFEAESRPWSNYTTDYKPLITFAKTHSLKFIATNVPRRYAASVAGSGVESLTSFSPEAQKLMAPLPYKIDLELPGYKNMLTMFGGSHGMGEKGNKMVAAQALKDATMAHFILKNLQPGQKFLHFNGSYHSDNFEGIYWYLKQQKPDLKIITISNVSQKELKKLDKENRKKADFILVVPEDAPKSY
ncbi:ChaN family lipoprotein [Adhaeribacter sp. BT258]|uniref:ChaN family lipoprotein n=1 Tax=Adhaeribacter terrigena TaxID=2793070 RepID=A0ABS1BXE0_9BACT|nr:ChaN family lipoprotein [Adhaeribacter terrigena]MBK0401745.1 ChaN family lipoprotein [Adhaeribacter terrigena]